MRCGGINVRYANDHYLNIQFDYGFKSYVLQYNEIYENTCSCVRLYEMLIVRDGGDISVVENPVYFEDLPKPLQRLSRYGFSYFFVKGE